MSKIFAISACFALISCALADDRAELQARTPEIHQISGNYQQIFRCFNSQTVHPTYTMALGFRPVPTPIVYQELRTAEIDWIYNGYHFGLLEFAAVDDMKTTVKLRSIDSFDRDEIWNAVRKCEKTT
jgi:hypothetical protein